MSRRAKFVFITWIGKNLSAMKKAKVSTDKALVKQICTVSMTCMCVNTIKSINFLNLSLLYVTNSSLHLHKTIWENVNYFRFFLLLQNFAVELLESEAELLSEDKVLDLVKKAGGANYGTGTRDWIWREKQIVFCYNDITLIDWISLFFAFSGKTFLTAIQGCHTFEFKNSSDTLTKIPFVFFFPNFMLLENRIFKNAA